MKPQNATSDSAETAGRPPNTITLDQPLIRGEQTISEISLRRPTSGDLRGLALANLAQLEVNTLVKLLPRISTPTLTEADVSKLDPADLLEIGAEVAGFFAKRGAFPGA